MSGFDYTTGNPGNLSGGQNASMVDIQGPFTDLKTFLNNRISAIPALVSSLPVGPVDGQECYFQADATNGIVWHLRYRAASGSTYKWECVGGVPMYAEVTLPESTSSLTYVALTTAGPLLVLPLAGDYRVTTGSMITTGAGATNQGLMSYDIGGTGASDNDATILSSTFTGGDRIAASVSRERTKTLATALTLTAKYRASIAAATTFTNRWIRAMPVRVG